MMTRSAIGLLLSLVAISSAAPVRCDADAPRPNILYFYVDDMGWGSIGPNGQAERREKGLPAVQTPTLDRLAAEGVNFSRGYGCHVCSPARSSQQSGFHQGHTFADRNDPDNAKKAMRADDLLMGDMLSAAGYATGYWGKWGYGGSKDKVAPKIDNLQTLPTSHGYRHVLAELHHVRAHTFFQPTLWTAPARGDAKGGIELRPNSLGRYQNTGGYPSTPALQNHEAYPETAYCDDSYAFAALDFVRAQGQNYNRTGQPFFGILAVQIPHAPFAEITKLPEWDVAYRDDPHFVKLADQSKQWAAMVTRIDAHFANILDALEDPDQDGDRSDSIADNTLVVFQSDNGGPGGKNNIELDANGGLRGNKGSIYEGGIRVPLVMRWPAMIRSDTALQAGSTTDRVVDVTDLLPTFCDLAEITPPLGVDGVSIAPTLTGVGNQRPREYVIHEAGNGQSIIRGNYKLVRLKRALQLYDLEADHGEENDLSAQHPQLVESLEKLLLGERVDEPRGFAVTYHHWTGGDGDVTSDADHWSDYQYANAGITYMSDAGAPRLSWVAEIKNRGKTSGVARVDSDLQILALEIGGNKDSGAKQSVVLDRGVQLVGRNEIRVAELGVLSIENASVSSRRWVEVEGGGTLTGRGTIDATVYNDGHLALNSGSDKTLRIGADYRQSESGRLTVSFGFADPVMVDVTGSAHLGGRLAVERRGSYRPVPGDSVTILTASQRTGRFDHPEDEVVSSDGTRFKIEYSDCSVKLTVR